MFVKKDFSDIVFSSRPHVLASAAALAAGAMLGTLAPLLSAFGSSIAHVAGLILSAGWTWAALAFCVGLSRKSRMDSSILAPASLIMAVIAYYVTKLTQGEFLAADLNDPSGATTHVDWYSFLSNTVVWCIAACILGSLLGLAGNLARNHGLRGLLFRVLVPLVAIVDTSQRLHFDAPLQGSVAATTWSVIRLIAVAVVVTLGGHTVITWWSRRSA